MARPKQNEESQPGAETLEESPGSAERQALQQAVEDAEREITQGKWVEHSEIEARLKEWSKSAA